MPWDNPEMYAKINSPSFFALMNSKTPTLVLHGELDYRGPGGSGDGSWKLALQLKKVPSKMVLFPDEGHWILETAK